MEFDSIGNLFGVASSSQNDKFLLIHSNTGNDNPSTLLIAKKANKKPIYAFRIRYASDTAISNKGHSAGISHDYNSGESLISCINTDGVLQFSKKSNSIPQCLAFDNTCKFLVVAFAGEENNIECYSIVWLDIKSGLLVKAIQAPDLLPVFKLSFNAKNELVIGN